MPWGIVRGKMPLECIIPVLNLSLLQLLCESFYATLVVLSDLKRPLLHPSWTGNYADGNGKAVRWALFQGINSEWTLLDHSFLSVKHDCISAELTKIKRDHQGSYRSCSSVGLEDKKGLSQDFVGTSLCSSELAMRLCG